ncbi:hypothetical protein [Leptospira stimsonii]|uniref:Uncharacterized protein n=1 Tax=Leptospira stimsonii TaxID=2202203 RepID=A0A396Z867_9LEPT|nr:hypothetical protein [Leptospira stimsonii]RHX89886.1 hypothetical protein DLM75_13105 [Leptospira stimsonii]
MKTLTEERPILFSSEMVCETILGRKNHTRRTSNLKEINEIPDQWEFVDATSFLVSYLQALFVNRNTKERKWIRCPYGIKGDLLWVRETWRVGAWDENRKSIAVDYKAGDFARTEWIKISDETMLERLISQSNIDAKNAGFHIGWNPGDSPCRWRPSIHMPRGVSRLMLEIKDIRIERLHEISEQDAEAEGVQFLREMPDADETLTARDLYEILWEGINGRDSWKTNPWVWVIEYQTWEDEFPY